MERPERGASVSLKGKALLELINPNDFQVFLFTGPATWPFNFGRHPWLVVNRKGAIARWEVFWRPQKTDTSWGYLHKDFYSPTQGIAKYFFSEKYLWGDGDLEGYVEGDLARRMADFIDASPSTYPYRDGYSLKGPNSNTYVQWVLSHFPESSLRLPWNSFGKGFKLAR